MSSRTPGLREGQRRHPRGGLSGVGRKLDGCRWQETAVCHSLVTPCTEAEIGLRQVTRPKPPGQQEWTDPNPPVLLMLMEEEALSTPALTPKCSEAI